MKKFENVIIASDMDGTFLTSDPAGMARNRERIAYFTENGGHFTFASGRTYRDIQLTVPDVAELTNAPVIAFNGACLYDFREMRELESRPLSYVALRELIAQMEASGLAFGCRMTSQDKHIFYRLDYPMTQREFEVRKERGEKCLLLPLDEWEKHPLYRMTVRGEDAVLNELIARFADCYRGRLTMVTAESTMMDVQDSKVHKAVVLQDMVARYYDRPMFLCSIGDYNNDAEMLKASDLACCPDNALDEIKAICHHTLCHKDQGVIDLLDTMF